jgi:hypothetical protein
MGHVVPSLALQAGARLVSLPPTPTNKQPRPVMAYIWALGGREARGEHRLICPDMATLAQVPVARAIA